MNTQSINVPGLFGEGWRLFKTHWKVAVPIIIILLIIQAIFNEFGLQTDPETNVQTGSWVVSIIGTLVSIALSIGVIDVFIGLTRGEGAKIVDMFTRFNMRSFVMLILATILFSIMFVIGLVLFIIPGIIVMLMFFTYQYVLIDQKVGALEALKSARAMTKGNRLNILFFIVMVVIVNIIGVLALIVGLLVSIPVTSFATALLYRQLNGEDIIMIGDIDEEDIVVVEEIVGEKEA